MTTDSENRGISPVSERAEDWRPVAPMDGCTYSGYEASDKGGFRSIDRKSGNRQLRGKVLATRRNDDGYRLINLRCDSTDAEHNRVHTLSAHKVVLWTFAGPPEAGQEACHSPKGPAFNWWPEGVRWGTKPENHQDQVDAGTAVVPEAFACRNAPRCAGTTRTEGRRCAACADEVGADAAVLLAAGMNLADVVARFGYKADDWLYQQAVRHGYAGTKQQARAQRPSMLQRVTLARASRKCHAQ